MKRTRLASALALSVASALMLIAGIAGALSHVSPNVHAQEKQPEHKMLEFHMALLKRGPAYNAAGMPKDLQKQHIANVMTLLDSGKAVIAGPLGDEGDIALDDANHFYFVR